MNDGLSVIYTWAVIGAGSLSDGILYQLQSSQIIAQHYPGKEVIHLPQPCLFTVFTFSISGPLLVQILLIRCPPSFIMNATHLKWLLPFKNNSSGTLHWQSIWNTSSFSLKILSRSDQKKFLARCSLR